MGGKSGSVTVGYRYFIGMQQVYSMSPADWPVQAVERIRVGEQVVWTGSMTANGTASINMPEAFGGEDKEGGVVGDVDIEFGGSTQPVNGYLLSKLTGLPVPAFRGLLQLVLKQVYVSALNPYIKPWSVFSRRNVSPWYTAKSAMGADINPVHIIRDALTAQYGLGVSAGRIDDASFQAAADTLFAEGLGLSVIWQSDRQSVEDFIGGILEIIDGALYEDQATGLWRISLARDDYSIPSLPIFDTSNISRVERFSQPLPGDLTSEVLVKFLDRETGKPGSVTVQDIAVLAIQSGQPVRAVREFTAIPTADLAAKIAGRELNQLATPLARATLIVNRAAWNLNIGDVFRFQWAPYGITDMVMRVASIGRGTLTDGRIRVEALQDIFSVAQAIYAPPPPSGWVSPISAPTASPSRLLIEAPYWVVAREVLGESPTLLAEVDDLDGLLLAAASRPTSDAYGYKLLTRAGSADYVERTSGSWCAVAEVSGAVSRTDTVFTIINGVDLDQITLDTWAHVDGELVKIIAVGSGTITVARGILDTVPVPHASGVKIWFTDRDKAVDVTRWVDGQTVNAKLLTRTGLGTLDEGTAPTDSLILDSRFARPYAPGNVQINGATYPASVSGDLTITWAHRDRTLQTAYLVEQDEANIGPEVGTTYTVRIYNAQTAGMLIRTYSSVSGTSQGYTETDATTDNGGSKPANIRIEIESVRDGFTSWQRQLVPTNWL